MIKVSRNIVSRRLKKKRAARMHDKAKLGVHGFQQSRYEHQ